MPLFAIRCLDHPDSAELRAATRPAHLAYMDGFGEAVRAAGPLLSDEGNPVGSLILIDLEDKAAAQTFASGDPYAKAGLFASTEIHQMRLVLGPLADA